MKVIIQDAKTKRYFSSEGRWVAARDEARDFLSLMQAYHYAKRHTSRRFAVVLFSPDDNYHVSIIEGEGVGAEHLEKADGHGHSGGFSKPEIARKSKNRMLLWSRFNACMNEGDCHLN